MSEPTTTTAPPEASSDPAVELEQESEIAADYIEGFLDVLDIDGDIDMDVEGVRATVSVIPDPSEPTALDALVGEDGEVLDALQDLTRLAVSARTGERSRLMLDVARFRATRRAQLTDDALVVVERVRASGEAESLDPMTPFERKVVHDAVASAGLASESDGDEPHRYVVVRPA